MNKNMNGMLPALVAAVGMAAFTVCLVEKKKNAPCRKMKKLIKKSAKTFDGIAGYMQYIFK